MALTIYPAIDLKGGQVVRLAEGDMARATVYADDPAGQAGRFAAAGATALHVVDLDGAFAGESRNGAAVRAIVEACPQLTSIDLSGCTNISAKGLCAIVGGCPQLTSINLSGTGISSVVVRAIANGCPQLTSINLNDT